MFTISMTKEQTVSQNTMPPIPPPSELSPGQKNQTKSHLDILGIHHSISSWRWLHRICAGTNPTLGLRC